MYDSLRMLAQVIYWLINLLVLFLFLKYIQENFRESYHFKALERAGAALRIFSLFLMVAMFYSSFLACFPFQVSILLISIGVVLFYQTKSVFAVPFILWGATMQLLMFLLVFATYGIWESI